jgi:hypothetical protein
MIHAVVDMKYTSYLVIHHKGLQATLYVNGKEIGHFGINNGVLFRSSIHSSREIPEPLQGARDPVSKSRIETSFAQASAQFQSIPASVDEKYFSAMVIFRHDGAIELYKNGLPVLAPQMPAVFPYQLAHAVACVPAEPAEEGARDSLKFGTTKEQALRFATLEEGCEIGAGAPSLRNPLNPVLQEKLLAMGYRGPRDGNEPELTNDHYTTIGRYKKSRQRRYELKGEKLCGGTGTFTVEFYEQEEFGQKYVQFGLSYMSHTTMGKDDRGPIAKVQILSISEGDMGRLPEFEDYLEAASDTLLQRASQGITKLG